MYDIKYNKMLFSGISHCHGDFSVVHAPDYMKFLPESKTLLLDDVQSVIQSSFGFSTDQVISTLKKCYYNVIIQNCHIEMEPLWHSVLTKR